MRNRDSDTASILVVEDDPAIQNLIATTLDVHGYQFCVAETGAQALRHLTSNPPDLMILDLGLPDFDGVQIIERLRGWSYLPVIVVSAREEYEDKVAALDAGADDYLVKPFFVEELLARVRVALRRLRYELPGDARESTYENGALRIDFDAGCVTKDGHELHLTPLEYKLLCLLARNTGKVLTHNYILKQVWGAALTSDLPTLRVFMTTLRKKIEDNPADPRYLQTHVGVGYRMLRVDDSQER